MPPLSQSLDPIDPRRADRWDQEGSTDDLLARRCCFQGAVLVSRLPGASATAVVPAHRPRRPIGHAEEPDGSESNHAAPSPGACLLTFEAREPAPGNHHSWRSSSLSAILPGSARHETTASALTCSCTPSGSACIPFRVQLAAMCLIVRPCVTHLMMRSIISDCNGPTIPLTRDRANQSVERGTTPPPDHHLADRSRHARGPRHAPPPSG